MLAAGLQLASDFNLHPSEISDWYDQECSATETSVASKDYFRTYSVDQTSPRQPEYWRIRDIEELDLSSDEDCSVEVKRAGTCSQAISQDSVALIEPLKKENTFAHVSRGRDEHLRDSVIWAPPLKGDTAILLKRAFLRHSNSSEETIDSATRQTLSLLRNFNASTTTIGTIFRRLSHPDFEQKSTHWIDIYFDFKMGAENRMHMKIRRDIPFRYCACVIACQLSLFEYGAEKNIKFFWPNENQELDPDATANDVGLTDNALIITQTGY